MNTLAERLKWARQRKGFSQPFLETATGIKQQMISKLEVGTARYTKDFVKLAYVLGVSPGWLMTGVGPIEPDHTADKEFVEFMRLVTSLTDRQREMLVNVMREMLQPNASGPTLLDAEKD